MELLSGPYAAHFAIKSANPNKRIAKTGKRGKSLAWIGKNTLLHGEMIGGVGDGMVSKSVEESYRRTAVCTDAVGAVGAAELGENLCAAIIQLVSSGFGRCGADAY